MRTEADIEIEGGSAIVAFRNDLASRQHNHVPRVPLTLVNVDIWREGQTVICKVAFGKVGEVTIRLSLFWARTVMLKLQKALK